MTGDDMAVSVDDLGTMDAVLGAPAEDAFATLRRRLPHLAWTRCDSSDVTEDPFRRYSGFDVHLLDGSGHCVRLTDEPATATGVLLARRVGS
ncbi:hypothetical protein [Nitrospirillum sp. BR 11163]|uniref:hypothetical protein n=1 Tax=Nitrospirillum sp. BR 11163 TaxID=3104323 RepID=UPI002AFF0B56|nr:hypothetical protein [Nitrospirillum sp. BR 11163]MEA1675933.1 hypothetical protein [Nitrospirillum sp. BR 11163]